MGGDELPVNQPPQLRLGKFILKQTGLEIDGIPERDEWESVLTTLIWFARNHPWWIGDLIRFGEARMGDSFYNVMVPDATVCDMIGRHAGVAKSIPPSQRDGELSWTHHREVVSLRPSERKQVFAYAKKHGVASGKMRKAVGIVRANRQAGMSN